MRGSILDEKLRAFSLHGAHKVLVQNKDYKTVAHFFGYGNERGINNITSSDAEKFAELFSNSPDLLRLLIEVHNLSLRIKWSESERSKWIEVETLLKKLNPLIT